MPLFLSVTTLCFAQWPQFPDPTAPTHGDLPESRTSSKSSKQDAKPLVFSSRSELVLVPVIVQDKNHHHVSGLSTADFTVLEDGQKRPIASLEEVHTTSAIEGAPSGTDTAVPDRSNQHAKRLAIIALDLINTPGNEQSRARHAVIDLLLRTAEQGTLIELLTIHPKGITVVHDFSDDPQALVAALRDVESELSNGQTIKGSSSAPVMKDALDKSRIRDKERLLQFAREADNAYERDQQADAASLTLAAFQRIAQSVSGLKGRKSLVWITAGLPFQIDGARMTSTGAPRQAVEHTMQLLNQANISIYPVDVRGLVPLALSGDEHLPVDGRSGPALQQALTGLSAENSTVLSSLQRVAEMTGGQAFFNRNDIDKGVFQALQDGADYYLLSYRLDSSNLKPGWRDLTVRTKGGYTVRARKGFYVTPATLDPALTRAYDLDNALSSPLPFTSLPLHASIVGQPQDSRQGKLLTFELELPPGAVAFTSQDDLLNLDIRIAATDARGERVGGISQAINSGLTPASVSTLQKDGIKYKNSFELPLGEYTLHFVVRDNTTGRIGSVIAHLKVG